MTVAVNQTREGSDSFDGGLGKDAKAVLQRFTETDLRSFISTYYSPALRPAQNIGPNEVVEQLCDFVKGTNVSVTDLARNINEYLDRPLLNIPADGSRSVQGTGLSAGNLGPIANQNPLSLSPEGYQRPTIVSPGSLVRLAPSKPDVKNAPDAIGRHTPAARGSENGAGATLTPVERRQLIIDLQRTPDLLKFLKEKFPKWYQSHHCSNWDAQTTVTNFTQWAESILGPKLPTVRQLLDSWKSDSASK